MKYCSDCGELVTKRVPEGDAHMRYICDSCNVIHYQNPRTIVGTIPIAGGKVLLCKRAIEPRKGFWTVPAGFMENGETTREGALRETWEEARAKLANTQLYRLFDLPNINQIYIFYLGELVGNSYSAGPESLEVELYSEDEIPWDQIAFSAVGDALKEYFEDRKSEAYPVRISDVAPNWRRAAKLPAQQ